MNPAVSIIVPVYNVEEYLRDCLDSILAQNFTNFEVILVNDGSTDQSGTICESYAGKDKRIKVLHKEFKGVSSARNVGVKVAQGDYIGFVDSDDRIKSNMYQVLYDLCVKMGSDISISRLGREIDGRLINKNKDEEQIIKEMDQVEAMRQLFKGVLFRFSLCNKLFQKSCFDGVQFPEGRIHEDLATTYKLFSNAKKAVFTNDIGYVYVKRKNSILTSNYQEKRLDSFVAWDKILPFMEKNFSQLSEEVISCYVYWCIDHVYYILDQVKGKRDRQRYLDSIQHCVRLHYKTIQKGTTVSFNHRYLIAILNYNVRLLILTNKVKESIKGVIR